jgi:hypothetical protein
MIWKSWKLTRNTYKTSRKRRSDKKSDWASSVQILYLLYLKCSFLQGHTGPYGTLQSVVTSHLAKFAWPNWQRLIQQSLADETGHFTTCWIDPAKFVRLIQPLYNLTDSSDKTFWIDLANFDESTQQSLPDRYGKQKLVMVKLPHTDLDLWVIEIF